MPPWTQNELTPKHTAGGSKTVQHEGSTTPPQETQATT